MVAGEAVVGRDGGRRRWAWFKFETNLHWYMTTRWLTPEEQRAWRAYIAAAALVEDALDRQLQQDAGMPHLYYSILATLSEAPERRLRMTDLAEGLKITRSRLTYAVTRLEKDGLVRREDCRWDKRGSVAALTEEGMARPGAGGPGPCRDGTRAALRPADPGAGRPAGGDLSRRSRGGFQGDGTAHRHRGRRAVAAAVQQAAVRDATPRCRIAPPNSLLQI